MSAERRAGEGARARVGLAGSRATWRASGFPVAKRSAGGCARARARSQGAAARRAASVLGCAPKSATRKGTALCAIPTPRWLWVTHDQDEALMVLADGSAVVERNGVTCGQADTIMGLRGSEGWTAAFLGVEPPQRGQVPMLVRWAGSHRCSRRVRPDDRRGELQAPRWCSRYTPKTCCCSNPRRKCGLHHARGRGAYPPRGATNHVVVNH